MKNPPPLRGTTLIVETGALVIVGKTREEDRGIAASGFGSVLREQPGRPPAVAGA
jgi:hypothetical protein